MQEQQQQQQQPDGINLSSKDWEQYARTSYLCTERQLWNVNKALGFERGLQHKELDITSLAATPFPLEIEILSDIDHLSLHSNIRVSKYREIRHAFDWMGLETNLDRMCLFANPVPNISKRQLNMVFGTRGFADMTLTIKFNKTLSQGFMETIRKALTHIIATAFSLMDDEDPLDTLPRQQASSFLSQYHGAYGGRYYLPHQYWTTFADCLGLALRDTLHQLTDEAYRRREFVPSNLFHEARVEAEAADMPMSYGTDSEDDEDYQPEKEDKDDEEEEDDAPDAADSADDDNDPSSADPALDMARRKFKIHSWVKSIDAHVDTYGDKIDNRRTLDKVIGQTFCCQALDLKFIRVDIDMSKVIVTSKSTTKHDVRCVYPFLADDQTSTMTNASRKHFEDTLFNGLDQELLGYDYGPLPSYLGNANLNSTGKYIRGKSGAVALFPQLGLNRICNFNVRSKKASFGPFDGWLTNIQSHMAVDYPDLIVSHCPSMRQLGYHTMHTFLKNGKDGQDLYEAIRNRGCIEQLFAPQELKRSVNVIQQVQQGEWPKDLEKAHDSVRRTLKMRKGENGTRLEMRISLSSARSQHRPSPSSLVINLKNVVGQIAEYHGDYYASDEQAFDIPLVVVQNFLVSGWYELGFQQLYAHIYRACMTIDLNSLPATGFLLGSQHLNLLNMHFDLLNCILFDMEDPMGQLSLSAGNDLYHMSIVPAIAHANNPYCFLRDVEKTEANGTASYCQNDGMFRFPQSILWSNSIKNNPAYQIVSLRFNRQSQLTKLGRLSQVVETNLLYSQSYTNFVNYLPSNHRVDPLSMPSIEKLQRLHLVNQMRSTEDKLFMVATLSLKMAGQTLYKMLVGEQLTSIKVGGKPRSAALKNAYIAALADNQFDGMDKSFLPFHPRVYVLAESNKYYFHHREMSSGFKSTSNTAYDYFRYLFFYHDKWQSSDLASFLASVSDLNILPQQANHGYFMLMVRCALLCFTTMGQDKVFALALPKLENTKWFKLTHISLYRGNVDQSCIPLEIKVGPRVADAIVHANFRIILYRQGRKRDVDDQVRDICHCRNSHLDRVYNIPIQSFKTKISIDEGYTSSINFNDNVDAPNHGQQLMERLIDQYSINVNYSVQEEQMVEAPIVGQEMVEIPIAGQEMVEAPIVGQEEVQAPVEDPVNIDQPMVEAELPKQSKLTPLGYIQTKDGPLEYYEVEVHLELIPSENFYYAESNVDNQVRELSDDDINIDNEWEIMEQLDAEMEAEKVSSNRRRCRSSSKGKEEADAPEKEETPISTRRKKHRTQEEEEVEEVINITPMTVPIRKHAQHLVKKQSRSRSRSRSHSRVRDKKRNDSKNRKKRR
jgi:hypothetical protein